MAQACLKEGRGRGSKIGKGNEGKRGRGIPKIGGDVIKSDMWWVGVSDKDAGDRVRASSHCNFFTRVGPNGFIADDFNVAR